MVKIKNRWFLIGFIVFFASLAYFFTTYKYYPGLRLRIEGYTEKDVSGNLYWDYGYGFNELDKKEVRITADKKKQQRPLGNVVIEPIDRKDDNSKSHGIWIVVDREDEGKSYSVIGKHHWRDSRLRLPLGTKIVFHHRKNKLAIRFFKSKDSGYVKISSDQGPDQIYSLYGRNYHGYTYLIPYWADKNGHFENVVYLPRHRIVPNIKLPHQKIKAIRFKPLNGQLYESIKTHASLFEEINFYIEKVWLQNSMGEWIAFPNRFQDQKQFVIKDLEIKQAAFFHPLLFSVQVVFAFVLGYLSYWICHLKIISQAVSGKDILIRLFAADRMWLFWIFFSGLAVMNFMWLLSDWPGSMTPDSVAVWGNIKHLKFNNQHPYFYQLFVLGLLNIYDSPVTVMLFQILCHCLISSLFFYQAYRFGLKLYLIIPFYLLLLISIPVNLHNITMWKDVPFALTVLFWALFLANCFYKKKYMGLMTPMADKDILLYSLLFLGVCAFRHNGLVYLPFIPVALLLCRGIPIKWIVKFCLFSAVLFSFYYFILPPYILVDKPEKNEMAKRKTIKKINKIARIIDTSEKFYIEDYFSDRLKGFITTMGTSPKATLRYNDMYHPPQRWFAYDEMRAEFKVKPKSEFLSNLRKKLLKTQKYKGLTRGRFIHWNSLFAFLALVSAFLLYKWLSVGAFFSSVVLYQAAALFFVVWPRWRFLYFLYLSGFFIIPLVLIEIQIRRFSPAVLTGEAQC